MNKKYIIFLLIGIVVFLSILIFIKNNKTTSVMDVVIPTITPVVEEASDEEKIKMLLDNKYNLDPATTTLTISENTGEYAKGGYGPSTPQGGGGLWFAAKKNGKWEIVYDGNGIITCDKLDNYPDYPVNFIPECWDTASNKMIER